NIGDQVQAGDVLAIVDAAQVGQAKTQLMQALAEEKLQRQNVTRLKSAGGAVARRQVLEAEAALSKAQAAVLSAEQALINLGLPVDTGKWHGLTERDVLQKLRFLGLPDDIRMRLDERMSSTNLVPVLAPMDGVVVERQVVAGEVVNASQVLFQVADTSRMWLMLNVPLEESHRLSVGQPVQFRPDGSRKDVTGSLNWISTSADKKTRMIRVRAELPNPNGQLRDETFGTGQIILREEQNAIVVPNEAIHWEGCCQIVFVRDKGYFDRPESPKVFHVRSIRLGARNERFAEVIAGVLPGEVIVTAGSDVLQAQLLKNNLGEGCACVAE
ncbi:MAG: efflux RND transporter periplasmic adaptor subunit, partial [Planctomycetaceae bacterium]|nr:efflux RND transporter periplasmic adaptor subunit [Planctomycetaceae bacterium]